MRPVKRDRGARSARTCNVDERHAFTSHVEDNISFECFQALFTVCRIAGNPQMQRAPRRFDLCYRVVSPQRPIAINPSVMDIGWKRSKLLDRTRVLKVVIMPATSQSVRWIGGHNGHG